jgi:hypothetical protein
MLHLFQRNTVVIEVMKGPLLNVKFGRPFSFNNYTWLLKQKNLKFTIIPTNEADLVRNKLRFFNVKCNPFKAPINEYELLEAFIRELKRFRYDEVIVKIKIVK